MILQCSECNARYLVPDQAIGADGRNVRCANCGHMWFERLSPEAEETLGELDKMLDAINARGDAQPEIEAKPIAPGSNLPALRRKRLNINLKGKSLVLKSSAITMGAVAAALLLLLAHPAFLGFPPTNGLAIADPGMVKLMQDNRAVYNINGKILNSGDTPRSAPTVRITLMDDAGVAARPPLNIRFSNQIIEPGKTVPFTSGNIEVPPGSKATVFSLDIGNSIELALRRKPD